MASPALPGEGSSGIQGRCSGSPSLWGGGVAGTKDLQAYVSMAEDNHPGKQISLLSSVLAWKFEAEPEPATHFSNLSNSGCLHYRYYLTPEPHNSFPLVFYIPSRILHWKLPCLEYRLSKGRDQVCVVHYCILGAGIVLICSGCSISIYC